MIKKKEKKKKKEGKVRRKTPPSGPATGANRVKVGKKKDSVLTATVDAAVEKELAKQAPDIPKETMKLMTINPPEAFIAFEAKTISLDERLKFKVLVNNLISGTLLADQITGIHALHPDDPAAAYVSLKKLIMKTYVCSSCHEGACHGFL